jgi:hypothetical protein
MQWWMILAIEFLLLGIGGILTDIRLSKRSGRMLTECPMIPKYRLRKT